MGGVRVSRRMCATERTSSLGARPKAATANAAIRMPRPLLNRLGILLALSLTLSFSAACGWVDRMMGKSDEKVTADAGPTDERILYYQLSGHIDHGWALSDEEKLEELEKLVIISSTMLGYQRKLHFDRLVAFKTKHLKQEAWHLITFEQEHDPDGQLESHGGAGGSNGQEDSDDKSAQSNKVSGLSKTKSDKATSDKGKSSKSKSKRTEPSKTKRSKSGKSRDDDEEDDAESAGISPLTIRLEWLNADGSLAKVSVSVADAGRTPPSRDILDDLFKAYLAAVPEEAQPMGDAGAALPKADQDAGAAEASDTKKDSKRKSNKDDSPANVQ